MIFEENELFLFSVYFEVFFDKKSFLEENFFLPVFFYILSSVAKPLVSVGPKRPWEGWRAALCAASACASQWRSALEISRKRAWIAAHDSRDHP